MQDLRLEGDILHVLVQHEVRTYEIFPAFLDFRARQATSAIGPEQFVGTERLFVGGGIAYPGNRIGFDTIDVSDPAAPHFLGAAIDSGPRGFKHIVANGSGLGIAAVGLNIGDPGEVWVYDVSDPLVTDQVLTEFTTPGGARAVSIFNGIGYVADSSAGLQAINYLSYDQQHRAPSIALSTNFADQLAEAGAVMRVSAAVIDDVQVRNVEFYVDGVRIATDGDFPFEHRFLVPPLSAGGFVLRARASDTGGNATFTDEITFTIVPDAIRPVVRRVSPPSGGFTSPVNAVAVFFSEPIDPVSLSGFTVSVRNGDTFVPVPGATLDYQAEINAAFVRFPTALAVGRYMATLPATVKDLAGNTLAQGSTWSFNIAALGSDRDQDCVPDSLETLLGLNPDDTDSDDDAILDGDEDSDNDGLNNCGEAVLGRDPTVTDSDGDGVSDSQEDADSDGIVDSEEMSRGADGFVTDPLDVNTDGDALDDAVEVAFGTNPTIPDAAADVVIDARTVTISGGARLNSLTLRNGAVLTHPAATADATYKLDLQIAGAVTIDATSRIDVSARGFVGGGVANAGELSGRTVGNVSGSTNRNGGSYGGLGGAGDSGGSANGMYGDPREPNDPGSGGGSDQGNNTAGAGGGVVRLTAGSLQLDGAIRANGGSQCCGQGTAGGSGGAIKLTIGTLSGSGTIDANGGFGHGNVAGGGSGGRIAVFYTTASGFNFDTKVQAIGGAGQRMGGPGSIYLQRQGQSGELVIRGAGRESPLDITAANERVRLDGVQRTAGTITASSVTLLNGAVLTHALPTAQGTSRLELAVDTLSIDATSQIDVSARGFVGGGAPNNGALEGRTLGNVPGSTNRNGGSYGGLGGVGDRGGAAATAYGDFRDPNEPGSGGGSDQGNNTAGAGGGVVRIAADTLTLNGAIRANGGSQCCGQGVAGGSGGAIKLTIDTLSGNGIVEANGGGGEGNTSGGGGGGRIAVHYQNAGSFAFANVQAAGGDGARQGSPGTVYLQANQSAGDLLVDGRGKNPSRATPLFSLQGRASTIVAPTQLTDTAAQFTPGELIGLELNPNTGQGQTFTVIANDATTLSTDPADGSLLAVAQSGQPYRASTTLDLLTITNHATVEIFDGDAAQPDRRGLLRTTDLEVSATSTLSQPASTPQARFGLVLDVPGTVTIGAMSTIDVSARGFVGGGAANAGELSGRTVGNVLGSTNRNGGSYGGLGGAGDSGGSANGVYGDPREPNDPGSGGGSDQGNNTAGAGGGVVRVTAGSLQLDGAIRANGGSQCCGQGTAGGSGGAIKLTIGTLSGSGTIDANGGFGHGNVAGGGSGGRIAVFYTTASGFNFDTKVQAIGGAGQRMGGPGSIYLQRQGQSGELVIRGAGRESPLDVTAASERVRLDGVQRTAGTITASSVTLLNGAVLTHALPSANGTSRLELAVDTLSIDATSQIDVSARGFVGGGSLNNGALEGRTLGNVVGSTNRNGGSYGGLGGGGDRGGAATTAYGDFRDPNEPGSGGGSDQGNNTAGAGGGVVRIAADTLTLNGAIRANGGSQCCGQGVAGGSGGAIKLTVDTLSGSGTVEANGGSGEGNTSGGGGGGRIAVHYQNAGSFAFDTVQAAGGDGRRQGSPGTVYLQANQSAGELLVDGRGKNPSRATPLFSLQGRASTIVAPTELTDSAAQFTPGELIGLELNPNTGQTKTFTIIANDATTLSTDPSDGSLSAVAQSGQPYRAGTALDLLAITNRAIVEIFDGDASQPDRRGSLTTTDLDVTAMSTLTHPAATPAHTYGLILDVPGTMTIGAMSAIDVSARGFVGGGAANAGELSGRTVGNVLGSTNRNGGSYGGLGGAGDRGGSAAAVYGDPREPNDPGSGGGSDQGNNTAGAGGGVVRLTAGSLQLDGVIRANGGSQCCGQGTAGGSGGAIKLTIGTLSGSGTIDANGGFGEGNVAGGGGGGRVAVFFDEAEDIDAGSISVSGGDGVNDGAPGTIVFEAQ